ncbi:MAG: LssY C-terminal domain-containing protein [Acidobacteriaceae bacterium]
MLTKHLAERIVRALLLVALGILFYGVHAGAQQTTITSLRIERKPGASDGQAMATVKGSANVKGTVVATQKTGRIARHVVEAWTILHGEGALLVLAPRKEGGLYRVRYYDADAGKGRMLGKIPFAHAKMVESTGAEQRWAFALAGTDPQTGHSLIFAGSAEALHGRLEDATDPRFSEKMLAFHRGDGVQSVRISTLMGDDVRGLILAPSHNRRGSVDTLQFLPNGDSLTFESNGQTERGRWLSDGTNFRVRAKNGQITVWEKTELYPVTGIPATFRIGVRLLQPLSSRTAKVGMEVKAVSITPAFAQSAILIPQGTEFDGKITHAHGIGLGIKHESAALTVRFDKATLSDGRVLPVDAWIYQVENSREKVTASGKIQGIRSTGTIGYSAENQLTAIAQVDPVAYIFLAASGPAILGFAEPEILYNAGTDLLIEFHAPVITAKQYAPTVPRNDLTHEQMEHLDVMVKELPFRTATEIGNKPSDITNLVFIGKASALRRAFDAAEWTTADTLTAATTFNTMKTLSGNETYKQAPMSTLLLDRQKPLFTLQKTTNTFSARHHLRVFPTKETVDHKTVLTASSTQDIGIAFSRKQKTFIHVIDAYLDNERSKIINDLVFTGCVDSVEMVPRDWVPKDAYNSTGDQLRTDGDAAVLYMNDCADPKTTSTAVAPRARWFERSERNTALTVKNTLYRGNLIYQGVAGGMAAHRYFAQQGELAEDTGHWRKSDASGTQYSVRGEGPGVWARPFHRRAYGPIEGESELNEAARAQVRSHRWDPPRYEIALNLGYSRYRNNTLEVTLIELESPDKSKPEYFLGLGDGVYDGWAAGFSLTMNSWNYISNEFSYMRQQTKFDLLAITISSDLGVEPVLDIETVGLTTRRAAYNTVFNLRPRKSRWRPYIAAGPVFQLVSLSDAPLKKPNGFFRLGLSNIGLTKAAFDFGSTPPLDGGGIFQFGLQYGAGFKFRAFPHVMLRTDFGETWSKNPEIIRDSYLGYVPDGVDDTYTTTVTAIKPPGKFIQQRATAGVAFTF